MKKAFLSSLFSTTFLITGVTTATLINSPSAEARATSPASKPVKEETKAPPAKEETKAPVTNTTVTDTKNDSKKDDSVTSGTGTQDVATFCQTSDAKIGSIIATACKGPMEGNDTGSGTPLLTSLNGGLFSDFVSSSYTWAMAGKSDESDSFGFEADNGASAGSWLLSKALPSSTFVLSLKTSTAYSAYLFTNIDFSVTGLKGVFDTIGVALDGGGKIGKALSHASLFYVTNQTPPVEDEKPPVEDEKPPVEDEKPPVEPAKVPEPGTIAALMMMGSANLLRVRRKRSSDIVRF